MRRDALRRLRPARVRRKGIEHLRAGDADQINTELARARLHALRRNRNVAPERRRRAPPDPAPARVAMRLCRAPVRMCRCRACKGHCGSSAKTVIYLVIYA